jgi:predicted transcriptional regulator
MQTGAHVTSAYSWIDFARPPLAAVVAKPVTDDGSTSYALNASTSSVDARFFEVRWDFDGDGVWDTDWSANSTIVHEFPGPGNYAVIVEIRDVRGLTNQSRINITVLPDHSSGLVSNGYFPLSVFFLGALLVGAIVLFFVWPVESLLIALLAVLLPLYTRLRGDDVLENYRRGMIHGFVLAHPGTSFTDMKEALSISSGSLVYHLSVLQDKGQVCCRRSGTYMRYYVNGSPMAEILRLGLTEFQMEIVKHVHSKGEASTQDIKESVAASRQTLHYNLKKLVTDGILSASFFKGHRIFRIAYGAESDLRKALGLPAASVEPNAQIVSQPSEDGSSRSPES